MAKTQTAHVVITANAKAAVEVMKMLKEQTDIYIQRLDTLRQKKQQGVALTKQEEKEAKELEKKIQALTTAQQKNEAEYRKLRDVMKNISGSTTKDLKRAYSELAKMLNNTTGEQVKRQELLRRKMQEVQAQIQKNTGAINGMSKAQSGFGGSLQTTLKNLVAYAGVFTLFNKVKSTLIDLTKKNAALSDSMANIRKVSQWTNADVEKLTENLAKIDTRNTLQTLQNLAYQGAKLGIGQYGVEGLTGFVKAAEQVQTALGEDLGEDALPALAKLTEVMGLIPKFGVEQAMQKAGSAIYQLGATSTATGKNIVEFSKRLMGLANVSGISADELLGLGAAADTMALMPEVAATAFNKLFNSIQSNTAGIAKAVGIAKEDLQSLIYEGNTMEALVKVFEKMQTMSMAEMEGRGVFKELGSNGARLTNVMITMASKVDMLKKSLETSNEAFNEGRAVINEYMIQQETASAYAERASNIWEKAFVNPEGVDIVKQLAQEWYNVSYEMTHSASTMASIKTTLELIAGAAKVLIANLPTLIQLMMFYGVGSVLQGIVRQFTAITVAATAAGGAMTRFNLLMKTNAIALAVTGVMMLVAKLYELKRASDAAAEAEEKRGKVFTDAAAEAIQAYNEQKKGLDKYYDALKRTNASEEERNDIIKQFKSEFGSYLEKLGIEINTYDDLTAALKRVNQELKDKAFYETGQKLKAGYIGDAEEIQKNAFSQYMQASQKYHLPTELMEDIVEGNVKTIEEAMQRVQQYQMSNLPAGKVKEYTSGGLLLPNVGTWQDVRTQQNKTFGDEVMDFLFGNRTPKASKETTDIYNAVNNLINATNEVKTRESQVDDFMKKYADKYSPNISVDGAILNLKRLKELNEDKLNEGLNVLRDEWKKMSENDRQTDRGKQVGDAIDQYSKQIRSLRGEGYNPGPSARELRQAAAAARKAAAERKQAARKELDDLTKESDAIIDKVEEFYRLQEATVEDAVADGKKTRAEADAYLQTLKISKNQTLAQVRGVLAGQVALTDEEWAKYVQDNLLPIMADQGDWSAEIAEAIMKTSLNNIASLLRNFNGKWSGTDITSTAFLDKIAKNRAGNIREVSRENAKIAEEVNKILLEYEYIEQASRDFHADLVGLGIMAETYEQYVKRIKEEAEAARKKQEEQAEEDVAWSLGLPDVGVTAKRPTTPEEQLQQQFLKQGAKPYTVNIKDRDEALTWLRNLMTDYQYNPEDGMILPTDRQDWLKGFPQLDQWEQNIDQFLPEVQKFYLSLIKWEDTYYEAIKKNADRQRKLFEERWERSGAGQAFSDAQHELGLMSRQQKLAGEDQGTTFGSMAGFTTLESDPEIAASMLRMEQARQELELMKQVSTDKELIREKEKAAEEAAMAMQEQIMAKINDRIQKLQQWADPINEFAIAIGDAAGTAIRDASSMSEQVQEALKNMVKAYGESTIKIISELMMQRAKKRLLANAMAKDTKAQQEQETEITEQGGKKRLEARNITEVGIASITQQYGAQVLQAKQAQDEQETMQEGAKARGSVMAGIAEGAAKIIGSLGWWGIPLIAVITALLNGLLSMALSALFGGSKGSSSTTDPTKKVKLVSGMLTYDEGNVGSYVGTDGNVYRATPEAAPKTGLVTQPIATTVQGNPALVAERGPEIVIGRQATRRILMDEPGLIRHLAQYDRTHSPAPYGSRGLRTYDEGTDLSNVLGDSVSGTDSAQLSETLTALTTAVLQLQRSNAALEARLQQPIRASINKYGTGGLIDEVQSGLKFVEKYRK